MNHSTQFEATPGGLVLSSAILLYSGGTTALSAPRKGVNAFASIHPVEMVDGAPVIGAGTPLTRAHLRQWAEALERNVAPEILPENVIVSHPDMVAWWVPEQVRPAYFNLSSPPDGLKRLGDRTCVTVPYPAHLFVATRSALGVFALPESKRPTADTVLLFSPILNIFINGTLCWGNVARPKTLSTSAIPEFEDAVFDSWSTHLNPGQERTLTGKGGLVHLWDDLAARQARRFPVKRLRPFEASAGRRSGGKKPKAAAPVTVGDIIAGGLQTW
ncbi:PRTRC genetic system protein B [Sphingomonas sp. BE123]|uniref:PRTRC system protein B n=1 Tax=Sphingomonas sp. BE123 TaxID=2817842 RepID=UPI0028620D2D|nr:PRTRC system protein B [Sphingomonas sp. BE123]MDR6851075.1 PRTRC genetic system protein B [Sphingomonas sp. BE123]